jgi:hypothetical protein
MKVHVIQSASIISSIETKLIKDSHSMTNMIIHEFQYLLELQLNEPMNMEMRPVQFKLIMNLIQMKQMKMYDNGKYDNPRMLTIRGISIG